MNRNAIIKNGMAFTMIGKIDADGDIVGEIDADGNLNE
jgi:hypothetical protein